MCTKRIAGLICLFIFFAPCVFAAPATNTAVSKERLFSVPRVGAVEPLEQRGVSKDDRPLAPAPLVKVDINVLGRRFGVRDEDINRVAVELREIAILYHQLAGKFRNTYYSNESLPAAALGEYNPGRRAALVPRGASFTAENLREVYNCQRSIINKFDLLATHFNNLATHPRNGYLNEAFTFDSGPRFLARCQRNAESNRNNVDAYESIQGMSINPYFSGYTLLSFSQFLNENVVGVSTVDGTTPDSPSDWEQGSVNVSERSSAGYFLNSEGRPVNWAEYCRLNAEGFESAAQSFVRRIVQLGARPPVLD